MIEVAINVWILILVVLTILGAPFWVPLVMPGCHAIAAKRFWQFSMRFLLALMAAECVAIAISVAFYRWLALIMDNWPMHDK